MKKTLFRQMITYMILFCIAICVIGYVVIEFLFNNYYYAKQQQMLLLRTTEAAAQIDAGADVDAIIDAFYSEYGVSLHYSSESQGKHSGMHGMMGRQGAYSGMTQENIGEFFVTSSGQGMGQGMGQSQWLSYLAQTQDGGLLMGRVSYGSMDGVVALVQEFFLYFGIANVAAFVLFAFFFSRSMSRPLRELNAIAAEMGQLNFSLHYDGRRRDEIGQLGSTLNLLMKRLENTITQLKGELSKEKTLEKMRTRFTAQVSHELQTPLSVIKGYAEALTDNLYEGEEASEVYLILVDEAEKISNMVDDLLNLSQIEAGTYVLNKQKFSLSTMLSKLYTRYRALTGGKRIHMHMDLPENLQYFGDEMRLEQAVSNVLTNAIKHTPDNGDILITLSKDKENILISIENDGEPISEEDLPHIFESYYRGKTAVRGTGLGLAITHHIISLHGGTITAANTKRGVLFEMILPL